MTASRLASILFSVTLVSTLAWPYLERHIAAVWGQRLFTPDIIIPVNRHTLVNPQGSVLPLTFYQNTILTAQNSPYLLLTTSVVPAGVTVTIEPGAAIYISEFGQLNITGKLEALGTKERPILMTSNEKNPANQTWNGLILENSSQTSLEYVRIFQASPAITCASGSTADISQADIGHASMGIFMASPDCHMKDSRILNVLDGAVGQGFLPQLPGVNISASQQMVVEAQ